MVNKLNTYYWEIPNFFGEVRAKNIKEATLKVVKHYINNVPYYGKEIARFEILIKLKNDPH